MKLRNISPFGALNVPLLRGVVEPGEVFDVTAEHATRLLEQPTNFEAADDEATALAEPAAEQPAEQPAETAADPSTEGNGTL